MTDMSPPTESRLSIDYVAERSAQTNRRYAFQAEDAPTLRHWQQALRAELIRAIGLDRIASAATRMPVVVRRGEYRMDDHFREDWEIWTEPAFRVPFFLLRPIDAQGRRPLVLTPHGHSKHGRYVYAGIDASGKPVPVEGDRDMALQAVRQGYIAIAPEARAFDESRFTSDQESDALHSCVDWQMRALMCGRTLIGERVWDIMRLIDYAATRNDVDSSRIVITGNSGGGTISLFAAAIDERISISIPGSFFCTFAASIGSIHHCPCNFFPGMLELGEMADFAGLIAPRPFLAVNGERDPIFPSPATKEAFAALQRIYTVADAGDRCELFIGDGEHRYFAEPVWPFVRRWFG